MSMRIYAQKLLMIICKILILVIYIKYLHSFFEYFFLMLFGLVELQMRGMSEEG